MKNFKDEKSAYTTYRGKQVLGCYPEVTGGKISDAETVGFCRL